MTTLLLLVAISAPPRAPAEPEIDAKQLAAWVAGLSDKDYAKQGAARNALLKAGPKAKAAVPDLIKLLEGREKPENTGWAHAIDVLGAIGPGAKDAVPALMVFVKGNTHSYTLDNVGLALAKIDAPNFEVTRKLLLASARCNPIVLATSAYLKENQTAVVGHLLTLCTDKDAEARRRAVAVLSGVSIWRYYEGEALALKVGDAGKEAPAVFEKMLTDEDAITRLTAARGLTRIAPEKTAKVIPAVIATMIDPKLKETVSGIHAADIFQPKPEEAAKALIPLFDGEDYARRWAIETLSYLPVRSQLEATLKDGKTARTREAAAMTLGAHHTESTKLVPALKAALGDRDFPVRFASAVALVNIGTRGSETAALGVPVLIEGLKREEEVTRLAAAQTLWLVGERARPAVPELKRALADHKPAVALEAALTLVEIARVDAADAVPALVAAVKSASEWPATRAARALCALGPVAKAAVPELVKRFEAKSPQLRIAAAEAAAVIDPKQGEKAASALTEVLKTHTGGTHRNDAVRALARIGPDAKAALPALLEEIEETRKNNRSFRVDVVLAVLAIDPETAKPVRAWIRERVVKEGDEDADDIAREFRKLGAGAKPLLAELIVMLDAKDGYVRECAAATLGAIGPDAKDALPRLKELAEKDASAHVRKLAASAAKSIEARP